jgi:hypothetical protein
MTFITRVAVLVVCLAPLAAAAHTQTNLPTVGNAPGDTTKADTTMTDSTKVAPDPFVPSTTSYFKGSDADMTLGSTASARSLPGGGWSLLNTITVERHKYRGRDMQDLMENFMNHASKLEPGLYNLYFSAGENYTKKTSVGLGTFGKDIVVDQKNASVSATFVKPVLGATRSLIAASAGGSEGLNDFKYDRSLNGMLSSTLNYDFGSLVRVAGGYGTQRQRQSSKVGKILFGPLPSTSDTVRAVVSLGRPSSRLLNVKYARSEGENRVVTPPRGNSLEILNDPSKAKREMIRTTNEDLAVNSLLRPVPFATLSLALTHDRNSQVYAVDTSLTKSTKGDDITATTSYQFSQRGSMSATVDASRSTSDFGPASLSSYREKENKISASASDSLTSSLYLTVSGVASLQQRFFIKSNVNPRDADYLYYHGDAAFTAKVFPGVTAGVSGAMSRDETRNIDKTLSGDNRVDYLYQVIPQLSLKPADWLTLSQQYTIKIEYTNFVYTADKNYLNRTTSLSTNAGFTISPQRLFFTLTHSYYMKDSGSYLSSGGSKKLYSPNNRNKEHRLLLNLQFSPLATFGVKAIGDFSLQRNENVRNQNGHEVTIGSSDFSSGGLLVGFTHKRQIGPDGEIDLDIAYNRRYGPFISAERKEYWDANTQIVVGF